MQYVALGAAGVGLLGLLAAVLALRSAARARSTLRELLARPGGVNLDEHVLLELRKGMRRSALVRYDALSDMGGRMSFSLALLNDDADGVVVSAINGRTESRCYGKAVSGGTSEQELSPEEKRAIAQAMGRDRATV